MEQRTMKRFPYFKRNVDSLYRQIRERWQYLCDNSLTFITLMMLFSLPYLATFKTQGLKRGLMFSIAYLAGTFFFLIFITVLTYMLRPQWLRKGIRLLLLAGTCIVCIAESFFIYTYGTMPDAAAIEVILATNFSEASEYIQSYVLHPSVLLGILAFAGAIALYIKLLDQLRCEVRQRLATILLVCFVGSTFLSTAMLLRQPYRPLLDRLADWPTRYCSIGYAVNETRRAIVDLAAYQDILQKANNTDINLTRNDDDLPYVVFILGESTARNHMSLYGYPLETTPRLQQRADAGELQIFTNVRAPYAQTVFVLEDLFTFHRRDMADAWYNYHNLFDILHQANVHTAWLSNQESSGTWGNVGRIYAKKCDASHFTQLKDSNSGVKPQYDEALLPLLDDMLKKTNTPRNFYVLHLMGSHVTYSDRYPAKFDVFHTDDEHGGYSSTAAKKIRAEYDNTILYNDYIIDEIIKRFEDKDSIVIYISDHGEEVYDERNFFGHIKDGGTHWMLEIPMIVWTSQSFRRNHPERITAMQTAADRSYVTEDIIHSMLDLFQIETNEYLKGRSIFNSAFNEDYYH